MSKTVLQYFRGVQKRLRNLRKDLKSIFFWRRYIYCLFLSSDYNSLVMYMAENKWMKNISLSLLKFYPHLTPFEFQLDSRQCTTYSLKCAQY